MNKHSFNKPYTSIKSYVDVIEPMGSELFIYFKNPTHNFVGRFSPRLKTTNGDIIEVVIDMERVHFFNNETEDVII